MDEIQGLLQVLIRKAGESGLLLAGVVLSPDIKTLRSDEPAIIHFGTLHERGYELSRFYRELASLIDKKTASGKLVECPVLRVV